MKKSLLAASVIHFLFCPSAWGVFSFPQEDETMARVQRLLMTSVMELPAEQWLADRAATGYQDMPAYKKFLEDKDYPYEALAKPSQTQAVRLAYGRVLQEFLMMRRGAAEQAGETGLFPCF